MSPDIVLAMSPDFVPAVLLLGFWLLGVVIGCVLTLWWAAQPFIKTEAGESVAAAPGDSFDLIQVPQVNAPSQAGSTLPEMEFPVDHEKPRKSSRANRD